MKYGKRQLILASLVLALGAAVYLREPLKTRLKIFHFPLIFSIIKL